MGRRWTTRSGRAKRTPLPKPGGPPTMPRTATMAIMEAAELARRRALDTGNERDIAVAQLALAADLAERRVGGSEGLAAAAKAAERYARAANTEDVVVQQGLPPSK